ncbi:MAG: hypothetical protein IJR46_05830 [Neisseriaceae bacterium]|nr:hypothetical protein [Neisseriaceae bacterium]
MVYRYFGALCYALKISGSLKQVLPEILTLQYNHAFSGSLKSYFSFGIDTKNVK